MRIQQSLSVPANGNSGNVLQGLVGSIIRDPSGIDFAAVADDVAGDITASFLIDTESVLINGNIPAPLNGIAGTGPVDPDNVIFRNEAAPAGSILNLTFFNAAAAPVQVRYWVNINPV